MKETARAPLIRLAKRGGVMNPKKALAIRAASIVLALILGSIPIMLTGNNPFQSYGVIIKGSVSNAIYLKQTIKIAVPLLVCSLAIAPCFKMRFWNIGAEGQITFGATCAAAIAIWFQKSLPSYVIIPLMFLVAVAGGALWAFIPGFFKAKYNTNETLFTLMMNYIAIGIVRWLQSGPWKSPSGFPEIPRFQKNTFLPEVFGVQCGWIIALILVFVIHIYMTRTKHGYEVAVIGDSLNTARYAGMNVGWVMMRTMLLSGAICGIVGFIILAGDNHTLKDTIASGYGFTAITVSWLSQLNAFVMIAIASLLAIISKGSQTLYQKLGVPSSVAEIVSGILLFCMLGCEFFINYKIVFRGHSEKEVHA